MNIKSRFGISILFILWLTIILAMFFIVQKPAWASVVVGLGYLLSTLFFWFLFVITSTALGYFFLKNLPDSFEKLLFSAGLGMGGLGVLGFLLVVLEIANKWVLLLVLFVILFFTKTYIYKILQNCHTLYKTIIRSAKYAPHWVLFFGFVFFTLSFFLALAPPIEAFDGLFYHLAVPEWWLRDGMKLVNVPHYWFPSLLEGMFLFPLAFNLDSTPQLIHWTFAVLSLCLSFNWTQVLFGNRAAWRAVAVGLSMPSLPWLASWAYTDMGLTFYCIGCLFALAKWKKEPTHEKWLILSAVFCGFAVGIKYTAFILPIICCLCLIIWLRNSLKILAQFFSKFVAVTLLTGGIWYLRNLIWMKNPFYPFVFGGSFWDSFRADWYSGVGSGIGLDVVEIILLPFITTLGFRDQNYFDGRIGPVYLILLPVVLYMILKLYFNQSKHASDIFTLSFFGLLSTSFWMIGVIQTDYLMQARLLFPALFACLPLFGKAFLHVESFHIAQIRFRFILTTIMALTILTFIVDFTLLVFFRNPIMASIGSITRQDYAQRFNSTYAELLSLSEKTPQDAFIYLINEPRSYGMKRLVQPDPINDNLAHNFYLYPTNEEIISAWQQAGYTHVIVRMYVFDTEIENQHLSPRFDDLRQMLIEIDRTEEYILYEIPD